MQKLLNIFHSKLNPHTREVIKKSLSSMIVKIIGMAAGLVVSIFLGRSLGAEGFGVIDLANRIISILLILTMFGMDNVIVKNIAIAHEREDKKHINDTIYTSSRINGSIAIIVAIIGVLLANRIANGIFNIPQLKMPLIIFLCVIVPQTFSRILAAGLIGVRKIWQSNLVDLTLSIWIVGVGLVVLSLFKIEINVVNIAILYAIGRLSTTTAIFFYWKKHFIYSGKKKWLGNSMMKMAVPLVFVSATSIITANVSSIMLGWLTDAKEVGLFGVAARIALLMSFFLQITNSSISPKLASLFADNRINEMSKMVKQVTGGLIIIASLFLIAIILGGKYILNLWGSEFTEAYSILVILVVGQFMNVSTGSVSHLLVMCGYEKTHSYISAFSVVLNILLNIILITHWGAIGAAIATTFVIILENLIKLYIVKKKVGIMTIPTKFNFK